MTFRVLRRRLAGAVVGLLAFTLPAIAHPHIFIDAKVTVVFNDAGDVIGLKNEWTFDQAFSVWMVQGLDTNGDRETSSEELQPFADDNMNGLSEYGFYTFAGSGDDLMQFTPVGDQKMVYSGERVTLSYSLKASAPRPVGTSFELGIYDPEYYVAITFADASDVVLENAPPACGVTLEPPKEMSDELQTRLYSLGPDVTELPPDLAAAMRGTQGMIVVRCDGSVPAAPHVDATNALDAVNQVAQASPGLPFGGPPPEPGLNLPRTGFFGWLQTQQREFYGSMNAALGSLRQDWTAFWLLGGLSFLYGVFHAAGPGHGKVVISSYVLANETQLRRGVTLSVLSALLQSVVAVVFVLIAAVLLGMTSVAMGDAANWIGIASYAMVALLGLWLIARKIFGWGHSHHHDDMAQKARGHLHDDHDHHGHDHAHDHHAHHDHAHHDHAGHDHSDHVHIVTPEATSGSLREQLSVVLAVGLRPCSGALVVLVFALSQGLLPAGIAAVFLMGAGTAITVATLATLAVTAKGLARRIGGVDNPVTGAIVWWVELLGAVAVLVFGVLLVIASL
ncbi:HoxN/HupN/NixA family nickel/cobalt transporter [Devosia sp. SL43]|uniref:HoxN/HupN/NixA family nickel/cobalt transporter n=1 Tax=Devosia sp. SL43 TaxID=2806348 RepID=UPI001F242969|nr:DUF1007 family protein [Devosia sp. SL43]UJW86835.1 DUF1007 family protein [Devosia sp. SL43]